MVCEMDGYQLLYRGAGIEMMGVVIVRLKCEKPFEINVQKELDAKNKTTKDVFMFRHDGENLHRMLFVKTQEGQSFYIDLCGAIYGNATFDSDGLPWCEWQPNGKERKDIPFRLEYMILADQVLKEYKELWNKIQKTDKTWIETESETPDACIDSNVSILSMYSERLYDCFTNTLVDK
jgi:hypothetical protein